MPNSSQTVTNYAPAVKLPPMAEQNNLPKVNKQKQGQTIQQVLDEWQKVEKKCKNNRKRNVTYRKKTADVSNDRSTDKKIIGWDEKLEQLKKQSIHIQDLWKQVGRPKHGYINNKRLHVKRMNKLCIKRRKRSKLIALKLANKSSNEFWKDWRNICGKSNRHQNLTCSESYEEV